MAITKISATSWPCMTRTKEQLDKSCQVKVLRDDYRDPVWEEAHFALFMADARFKGDDVWFDALAKACSYFRSGNEFRLLNQLDEMQALANN